MRIMTLRLTMALLLGSVDAARAQPQDDPAALIAAAEESLSKGHYAAAAVRFETAFVRTARAPLLVRSGEAWEKAGQPAKAVDLYRRYLDADPQAADRTAMEARIRGLEEKHRLSQPGAASGPAKPASDPSAPPAPPADSPSPAVTPISPATGAAAAGASAPAEPGPPAGPGSPPPPLVVPPPTPVAPPPAPAAGADDDHPSRLRVAGWVSIAAAVALLTAGAICGLAAQERGDEITRQQAAVDASRQPAAFDAVVEQRFRDLYGEGRLYNGLAIGLMSGAGAAAVISAVLFIADSRASKKAAPDRGRVRLVPALGPQGGGVLARVTF